MTVKATYNGMTYEFPDGTPDEVIYSQLEKQFSAGNKDYVGGGNAPLGRGMEDIQPKETSWGLYNEEDGSIWDTAKKRVGAQVQSMLSSAVEDPTVSRYSMNKLKNRYDDWKQESEKLGVAGNIAAGLTAAAAPIGLGAINPALGAAAMGAQSTGDALLAQYEEGQPLNFSRASDAGLGSAAFDIGVGGAARHLAKPVSGLWANTKNIAQQTAVEDIPSNIAAQIYENMASGRDWNQDTDVAALMGGGAGMGLRGSFAGMNKALQIPFNKGGEKAINDTVDLESTPGPKPSDDFKTNYVENRNAVEGLRERLTGMSDEGDIRKGLDAINNQLEQGAHLDATARIAKALQKNDAHIIDSMYDMDLKRPDGSVYNIGVDGLKLTKEGMTAARDNLVKSAQTPFIHGGQKATKEAITGTAFNEKSQKDGRNILSTAKGYMDANLTNLKKRKEIAAAEGAPKEVQALWNRAFNSYNDLIHALEAKNKESGSVSNEYTARILSRDFNDAITRLGESSMIKDMNGETGNLNTYADYMAINGLTQGFRNQNYQFNQGRPDTLKEGVNKFAPTYGTIAAPALFMANPLLGAGIGAAAAVREGYKLNQRRRARKTVEKGKSRVADLIPEDNMTRTIDSGGSGPEVVAAAKVDLENQGIQVPEATVAKAVEQPVEAPVTTPEPAPRKTKPEAKTRPAPRPKATEEVVEAPAVEPVVEVPKVEAKAPAAPKESRKAKRDKAKADRAAKRQAEQARIAAELQEKIQAQRAAGKAAKAPKQKEVEEVVEPAPVEAPVETPKEKPEAKAAKAPKAKEIDTVVTEPVVEAPKAEEAPKPKPEAKAARAPKEKEVEQPTPQPETPKEAATPLGKVKPHRKRIEKPEEPKVEEPKVEEPVETAPVKPKVDAKTVSAPVRKKAEESWPIGRREKDPKGYQEHVQARQDLKEFNKLIDGDERYSKDEMADFINDFGGIEKFLADAKEADIRPATFLRNRIRERETLAKQEAHKKAEEMKEIITAQAKKETADTEVATAKSAEEASKAKRIAEVEEFEAEMDARGIQEEDAKVVRESLKAGSSIKNARILAQRLNKERQQRMEQDIRDTKEGIKNLQASAEQQGKRARVDEYLRGVEAEGIPQIKEMVDKTFKHATKVSDSQVQTLLNKIDSFLEAEKKRYESLTRGQGADNPYHAAGMVYQNAQKALRANRKKIDALVANQGKQLSEDVVALQKAQSDYDRLFRDADTRDANIEIVSRQKEDMANELKEAGVPDDVAAAHIKQTFYKREATPLNPRELRSNLLSFFDGQAKERQKRITKKKAAVDKVIKDADEETMIEMAQNLVADPDFAVGDIGDVEGLVAMSRSLKEAMTKKGLEKEAVRLETMNNAILEGLENKMKYPDNPELWVPADPFIAISRTFGNKTSAYQGNLGVTIKLMVTGDKEGLKGFGTKKRSEMIRLQRKLDGEKQGALLTGDSDIIVK